MFLLTRPKLVRCCESFSVLNGPDSLHAQRRHVGFKYIVVTLCGTIPYVLYNYRQHYTSIDFDEVGACFYRTKNKIN